MRHRTQSVAYAYFTVALLLSPCPDPALRPIRTVNPALKIPGLPRRQCPLEQPLHLCPIIGMNVLQKHLKGPLGQRRLITEDAIMLQSSVRREIGKIERPPAHVAVAQREAQPVFRKLQLIIAARQFRRALSHALFEGSVRLDERLPRIVHGPGQVRHPEADHEIEQEPDLLFRFCGQETASGLQQKKVRRQSTHEDGGQGGAKAEEIRRGKDGKEDG